MRIDWDVSHDPLVYFSSPRAVARTRGHAWPRSVAAVVLNGVHPFELGVACEVFGLERPELKVPWYRFKVCAAEPSPVRSQAGFLLDTPYSLNDLEDVDTLVFTHWRSPDEPVPQALLDAVRAAHARGAR